MSEPNWDDVSESVESMIDSLNEFTEEHSVVKKYLADFDTSKVKKVDATALEEAYHLCTVVEAAHMALCELSVTLFNKLQKATGRSVGW